MKRQKPADWAMVPNSTQVPDAYFDHYFPLLTDAEVRVLLYLCRRIFGFHKDSDAVAVKQICSGICTRVGVRLDSGTGLGHVAVAKAIEGLVQHGLVKVLVPADYGRRLPAQYALCIPTDQQHAALLERAEGKAHKNQRRMAIAKIEQEIANHAQMSGAVRLHPKSGVVRLHHNKQ